MRQVWIFHDYPQSHYWERVDIPESGPATSTNSGKRFLTREEALAHAEAHGYDADEPGQRVQFITHTGDTPNVVGRNPTS